MRSTLLIGILFFTCVLSGQDLLSLSQAIRIGLNNSFGLQIAGERTKEVQAQLDLFKTSLLPRINLNIRQNNIFEVDNSPTSFVEGNYIQNSAKAAVDVDWTIFDGFRARFEQDRYAQLENRATGTERLFIENATQAIIIGYYKALFEKQKQDVVAEVTGLSKDRYIQGQLLLNKGSISEFDLLSLENAWLKDSINYMDQSLSAKLAMDDLKFLMGVGDDTEYTLEDELVPEVENYNLNELDKNLVENNEDIKMQYLNILIQEIERGKLKADRYPKVRLNSSLSQDINTSRFKDEEPITGSTFDFYAGFTVDFKLFDGGRTKKLIEQNKIKEKIALLELEDMEYKLKDQLRDAYYQYENHRIVIQKEKLLLVNLQRTLDIAKERMDGGYAIPLEYRNSQLDYLNGNIDLLSTIFKLKSVELIIVKLTGGLTASAF